ncbi:hypothetical protein COCNU_scaffold021229G000020 [Cocos nucifera]|nr:hypothetical protein [Cocos nucifera]
MQMASILLFLRALMKRENDGAPAALEEFGKLDQHSAQQHATKRQNWSTNMATKESYYIDSSNSTGNKDDLRWEIAECFI